MIDSSVFKTFSYTDPGNDHTHALRHEPMLIRHKIVYVALLAMLLAIALPCHAVVPPAEKDAFTKPDVLVLVLGGFGPQEQCSVNYDAVLPTAKAQADLFAIAGAGRWAVSNANADTKAVGGPKPVRTTSVSFTAPGLIGYADGTLPLEPFLVGLKRYKFIEIDYITPSGFSFHGLKDFENSFVKIQMNQSGNSYRYRVVVKDAGFKKLDLPLREEAKQGTEEPASSSGRRLVLAIGVAVIAAAAAYLVMMYMSKRGQGLPR